MALTTGLIAYYKLDESSGNAVDSFGGNTMTNTSVTYTTGKINNGATMGGVASARLASAAAGFDDLTESTYAGWIKITTNQANNFLFTKNDKWTRLNVGGTLEGNWGTTTVSASAITNNALSTGTWYHIVYTYSNSGDRKIHIYINGTEATYGTDTAATGTLNSDAASDFYLGNYTGNATPFAGMLDEAGVWNRVLSQLEITSLYASGYGYAYPLSSSFKVRQMRPALFKPGNSK